jgi:hypothetical protein
MVMDSRYLHVAGLKKYSLILHVVTNGPRKRTVAKTTTINAGKILNILFLKKGNRFEFRCQLDRTRYPLMTKKISTPNSPKKRPPEIMVSGSSRGSFNK